MEKTIFKMSSLLFILSLIALTALPAHADDYYWIGGNGTFNQSGGTLSIAGAERIGVLGTGSFTQTGESTHTVGVDLVLGNDPGSDGTYNLCGGDLNVYASTLVGNSGIGTFNQDH